MRSVSPLNRTLMSATVTVATFSNMQEASIVQGMLESNGIPSMISDQNNLYALLVAHDERPCLLCLFFYRPCGFSGFGRSLGGISGSWN